MQSPLRSKRRVFSNLRPVPTSSCSNSSSQDGVTRGSTTRSNLYPLSRDPCVHRLSLSFSSPRPSDSSLLLPIHAPCIAITSQPHTAPFRRAVFEHLVQQYDVLLPSDLTVDRAGTAAFSLACAADCARAAGSHPVSVTLGTDVVLVDVVVQDPVLLTNAAQTNRERVNALYLVLKKRVRSEHLKKLHFTSSSTMSSSCSSLAVPRAAGAHVVRARDGVLIALPQRLRLPPSTTVDDEHAHASNVSNHKGLKKSGTLGGGLTRPPPWTGNASQHRSFPYRLSALVRQVPSFYNHLLSPRRDGSGSATDLFSSSSDKQLSVTSRPLRLRSRVLPRVRGVYNPLSSTPASAFPSALHDAARADADAAVFLQPAQLTDGWVCLSDCAVPRAMAEHTVTTLVRHVNRHRPREWPVKSPVHHVVSPEYMQAVVRESVDNYAAIRSARALRDTALRAVVVIIATRSDTHPQLTKLCDVELGVPLLALNATCNMDVAAHRLNELLGGRCCAPLAAGVQKSIAAAHSGGLPFQVPYVVIGVAAKRATHDNAVVVAASAFDRLCARRASAAVVVRHDDYETDMDRDKKGEKEKEKEKEKEGESSSDDTEDTNEGNVSGEVVSECMHPKRHQVGAAVAYVVERIMRRVQTHRHAHDVVPHAVDACTAENLNSVLILRDHFPLTLPLTTTTTTPTNATHIDSDSDDECDACPDIECSDVLRHFQVVHVSVRGPEATHVELTSDKQEDVELSTSSSAATSSSVSSLSSSDYDDDDDDEELSVPDGTCVMEDERVLSASQFLLVSAGRCAARYAVVSDSFGLSADRAPKAVYAACVGLAGCRRPAEVPAAVAEARLLAERSAAYVHQKHVTKSATMKAPKGVREVAFHENVAQSAFFL